MSTPTINLIARTPFQWNANGIMVRLVLERHDTYNPDLQIDEFVWRVYWEPVNENHIVVYHGPDREKSVAAWWQSCIEFIKFMKED